MPTLLYIEASPREARSRSSQVAGQFVRKLRSHEDYELDHVPLWGKALPELDGALLEAKYARLRGDVLNRSQAQAWSSVEAMVAQLDRADRVLISTPMWNFGIPYRLKHYIDLITQPGLTFSFDPQRGYAPLLRPRRVDIVLASAGDYRSGPSWGRPDLATPYLRAALAFIGLSDVRFTSIGPTVGPDAVVEAAMERAMAELQLRSES